MKLTKTLLLVLVLILLNLSPAVTAAGDFDWMRNFNLRAEADPTGFRASLATRFKIGDTQINAVLGNVERAADAYMVLRLGEMSGRPTNYVIDQYRSEKKKGWGALAKSLGIKPGSPEFHALKRGDDMYGGHNARDEGGSKGKGKGKGRGK